MTIDTQEALRLLDELYDHATDCCELGRDHSPIDAAYHKLRALLSEDGEPSAANWRQAIREHCASSGDSGAMWIEQRAIALRDAEKEKGNG